MKLSVTKYELWNALFMCPDEQKTDDIRELEKQIEKSIPKYGRVVIDIRED
ncbi:hypothetical protein [Niallia taxi]|uniref:hypothetical protein n=1 Tax=Niallia taxi TaxID=2499688 RepID=UPI003008B389